jgi:hypothetical protein
VLGLVIATALDWGNVASIAIAGVLAFFFGYLLTLRPLVAAGVPLRTAARIALAADTASIVVMEIVDNAFVLLVPGAMEAGLSEYLFWWSLGVGLFIAFWVAFPINRALIVRGRGHAVVHEYHSRPALSCDVARTREAAAQRRRHSRRVRHQGQAQSQEPLRGPCPQARGMAWRMLRRSSSSDFRAGFAAQNVPESPR